MLYHIILLNINSPISIIKEINLGHLQLIVLLSGRNSSWKIMFCFLLGSWVLNRITLWLKSFLLKSIICYFSSFSKWSLLVLNLENFSYDVKFVIRSMEWIFFNFLNLWCEYLLPNLRVFSFICCLFVFLCVYFATAYLKVHLCFFLFPLTRKIPLKSYMWYKKPQNKQRQTKEVQPELLNVPDDVHKGFLQCMA